MITIVLDGYNVIHGVPELERKLDQSLEAAREALLTFCQAYRARRGDVQQLYVVFDGNDAYAGGPIVDRGGVTVLFTRSQEEADDRILRLIKDDHARSRFVIVSNDNYVFNNARAHGARVISVSEFSAKPKPGRAPRAARSPVVEKTSLSLRAAEQITEEYRRHLEGKMKVEDKKPSTRRIR